MAAKKILTAARLRELLRYNPETGEFTRLKTTDGVPRKKKVGCIQRDIVGRYHRRKIGVDYTPYLAHRLAWLWMTGEWPKHEIDHINRNPLDNRWANLRDVPRSVNGRNKGRMITNTSGTKHLSFNRRDKLWVVHFSYPAKEDAIRIINAILTMND